MRPLQRRPRSVHVASGAQAASLQDQVVVLPLLLEELEHPMIKVAESYVLIPRPKSSLTSGSQRSCLLVSGVPPSTQRT